MKQRNNRLAVIMDLIRNNSIDSQETLVRLLEKEGYSITQATLSRDLKILKVGKVSDGLSGYRYALPGENTSAEVEESSYVQDVRRGIVSIQFSGNIGVLKTRVGHANSVAAGLESLDLPQVLGTIAGDDTIMVVLREGSSREEFVQILKDKVPDLEG